MNHQLPPDLAVVLRRPRGGPPFALLIIAALAAAAVLLPIVSALGAEPAPSADWYATNEQARQRMMSICRNYPGPASRSDHCAAAAEGTAIAAAREAQRRVTRATTESDRLRDDWTSPNRPEYWMRRPQERADHLRVCDAMDPEAARRAMCGPAREADRRTAGGRRT